jgi:hypothetical protein
LNKNVTSKCSLINQQAKKYGFILPTHNYGQVRRKRPAVLFSEPHTSGSKAAKPEYSILRKSKRGTGWTAHMLGGVMLNLLTQGYFFEIVWFTSCLL